MDLEQLTTFKTIVELKNYSKAAKVLNVTQPAVTSRIIKLEQELNIKLFTRIKQSHTLLLTQEGELFIPFADRILEQAEEAKNIYKTARKTPIRIGFPPGISSGIISSTISKVQSKDINIFITDGANSSHLIEMLIEEQIDIAVTSHQISHEQLTFKRLIDDPLVFIVNKNHRLAQFPNISPAQLAGETYISHDRKSSLLWPEIERILDNVDINFIESKHQNIQTELVKLGQGFAFVSVLFLDKKDLLKITVVPFKEINEIHKEIFVCCRKDFINYSFFTQFQQKFKQQIEAFLKDRRIKNKLPQEIQVGT